MILYIIYITWYRFFMRNGRTSGSGVVRCTIRHILKFISWYIIQHIFVPTCSVGRKTWFSRKPWFSNSKFGISGSFWPILSVPKIMFLVPENEKRNKFSSFFLKEHRKNSLKNIVVFTAIAKIPQGHRTAQTAHCAMRLQCVGKNLIYSHPIIDKKYHIVQL